MTNNFIPQFQDHINLLLQTHLASDATEPQCLHQAMRYAIVDGGKRVRPLLVYVAGQCLDVAVEKLDAAAAAVEMIHCYSLVHDDLPAMDDDDLRRGKPTCHKAFDEATAILAGDAIQAKAFEILAADQHNEANVCLQMIKCLADACGSCGMAGGQSIDLLATGQMLNLQQLQTMHQLKTGALIKASVLLAAIIAQTDDERYQQLAKFGDLIGLAFQIHDDILDVEGETEKLGKTQGADQELNKATYPAILGIEKAKHLLNITYDEALTALSAFGKEADNLRALGAFIVQRDY